LNVIEGGHLLQSRMPCVVGDVTKPGWTALWHEARQLEVIWELACLWAAARAMGLSGCLEKLYAVVREKKVLFVWGLTKYLSMPLTSLHQPHTYLATYRYIA